MSGLRFTKMHGLGNDFVILDARGDAIALDAARARAIAEPILAEIHDIVGFLRPKAGN